MTVNWNIDFSNLLYRKKKKNLDQFTILVSMVAGTVGLKARDSVHLLELGT